MYSLRFAAAARRYRRESPDTVVVVLLDEVGLAEQSPHLPLKVLHKTLDEAEFGDLLGQLSSYLREADLRDIRRRKKHQMMRAAKAVEKAAQLERSEQRKSKVLTAAETLGPKNTVTGE